jgi:hypothetical protein
MKRKLLGFGSIFCPAFVLIAIAAIVAMPFFVDMGGEIPVPMRPFVVIGMILLLLSGIGTWFFIIFDIIHAAKNPAFSGGVKAAWICAIWFLNVFVIPIYWAKHLRHEHRTTPPTVPEPARGRADSVR